MFDWIKYDNSVKKGFEEQKKQISEFLKRHIEKNAQIRELPLFDRPDQETLDRIAAMDIPTQGRDPLAVGEELINDVFEHAMLLQHPRFYSFVASAVSPYPLRAVYSQTSITFMPADGSYLHARN